MNLSNIQKKFTGVLKQENVTWTISSRHINVFKTVFRNLVALSSPSVGLTKSAYKLT